eukprot:266814_1
MSVFGVVCNKPCPNKQNINTSDSNQRSTINHNANRFVIDTLNDTNDADEGRISSVSNNPAFDESFDDPDELFTFEIDEYMDDVDPIRSEYDTSAKSTDDNSYESIPSMRNVLTNHPQYISYELLGLETINTCDIDIPVDTIDLPFKIPFESLITAVADNGANINAIDGIEAMKYYKSYIQSDRRPFRVRTGSYKYLIGRSMISAMGYALRRTDSTWTHHREVLDTLEDPLPSSAH